MLNPKISTMSQNQNFNHTVIEVCNIFKETDRASGKMYYFIKIVYFARVTFTFTYSYIYLKRFVELALVNH